MNASEERFRSSVRHFGVRRADLTRREYAERLHDVKQLTGDDRVLYEAMVGRLFAEGQHEARRAQRLAAGLPATVAAERGRKSRFCDPESEPHWISEARRLGLDPGGNHTVLRLIARRLSDAATEELTRQAAKAAERGTTPPATEDDDVLARFYTQEWKRWRRDAKRARVMLRQYEELETMAAYELGRIEKRRARKSQAGRS